MNDIIDTIENDVDEKQGVERCVMPPVCSDHDADCKDIKSPLICFIGHLPVIRDGVEYHLPMADGICPLMGPGA